MSEPVDTRLNWVTSFPKSGNTWIRLVCFAYLTGDVSFHAITSRGDHNSQVWHEASILPPQDLCAGGQAQTRPAVLYGLAMRYGQEPMKSHHGHFEVGGLPLWHDRWTRKVVVPVRDPRDVACSVADYYSKSDEEAAAFLNTDGLYISDGEGAPLHWVDTWSEHVLSWLECDKDTLIVQYEDMVENDVQAFADVLSFLYGDINEERAEWATKACRFENLRKKEEEEGFPETSDGQDRFFRRGEAGAWRDELPANVAGRIVDDHREVMERMGYID